MNFEVDKSVLLFDGVCNLCNTAVQTVIKNDPDRHFKYASLQSGFGQSVLRKTGRDTEDFDSFILLHGNKVYDKSSAALRVASKMKLPWSLFYPFIILPKFLRDAVYTLVAKNRYKWFGKRDECMIPSPELKALFLN